MKLCTNEFRKTGEKNHSISSSSSSFSFFTDFLSSSPPSVISAISPSAVVTVVTRLLMSPCDCTSADRYFLLLDSELFVILSWTVNLCLSCFSSSFWLLIVSSRWDKVFLVFSEEKTRIVRESDYSPASQLFCRVKKTMTGNS